MKPKNSHLLCFVWYFYQFTMYQKSEWHFYNQGSIDGKNEVKVDKCHLVTELKNEMLNLQKVTFSISTLLPGEVWTHFSHLWTIGRLAAMEGFWKIFSTRKRYGYTRLRPLGRINPGLQSRVWCRPDPNHGLYSLTPSARCYSIIETLFLHKSLNTYRTSIYKMHNNYYRPAADKLATLHFVNTSTVSIKAFM